MSSPSSADSPLQWFLENGYVVRGVVHVGSNDGAEVEWYLSNSCEPILCFDPHPTAIARAEAKWGSFSSVRFVQAALGDKAGKATFVVPADGDDEKTSRYKPIPTEGHDWTKVQPGGKLKVDVVRFDEWFLDHGFGLMLYNTLVVDAQGMELEVLRGFGGCLAQFELLCVELSEKPVYKGEVPADDVIQFLDERGFRQASPVKEHDNVLFVK